MFECQLAATDSPPIHRSLQTCRVEKCDRNAFNDSARRVQQRATRSYLPLLT